MSVQIRNTETGLIAQVGPDYFAAMPNMGSANVVRNVFSIEDERHELSDIEFRAVTDSCGIPREEVRPGNFWTRDKATFDKVAHIEKRVDALSTGS